MFLYVIKSYEWSSSPKTASAKRNIYNIKREHWCKYRGKRLKLLYSNEIFWKFPLTYFLRCHNIRLGTILERTYKYILLGKQFIFIFRFLVDYILISYSSSTVVVERQIKICFYIKIRDVFVDDYWRYELYKHLWFIEYRLTKCRVVKESKIIIRFRTYI